MNEHMGVLLLSTLPEKWKNIKCKIEKIKNGKIQNGKIKNVNNKKNEIINETWNKIVWLW